VSAGDVAAIVVAVASAVLCVGLVLALASLSRTLRSVRLTVEELRQETVPLLGRLRTTIEQANAELNKVDGVLEKAESIGATLDSGSRLAYLAFSNPLIKLMALGAGTRRAARRLRRRRDEG